MRVKAVQGIIGSNTFIVQTESTTILVDAGARAEDIKSVLNGIIVDAVLLTHEHYDHVFYSADYCDIFGCPIYCHQETKNELITGELNSFLARIPERIQTPAVISVIPEEIVIGDLQVRTIHCPGHSAGSVIYLINQVGDNKEINAFTGDVLFANTIGRTDLMDNGPELMQQTLKNLLEVRFDIAYHGHSRNSTYQEQQANIKRFIK